MVCVQVYVHMYYVCMCVTDNTSLTLVQLPKQIQK